VRSSDGKARPGNISRQGSSILRWALVEAATHLATRGGPLREQFERIAKRRGRKVARVAVTRQILTLRRSRLEQYRDPRPPRCDCSVTDGAVRRAAGG
jgi:transposase